VTGYRTDWRPMNRTGLIVTLAIAAAVGLVFGIWPELDLKLAALFYDPGRNGFWRAPDPTFMRLRNACIWLTTLIALSAALAIVIKLVRPKMPMLIPGRAVVLMLTTLALGPGVLTNVVLKEHWGRPRPIDVAEFKGDEHFRPWWDPRGDCARNCSFVAGDPSGAFWTLAPAVVAPPAWRMLAVGAALAFGAGVGLLRMMAGAHFFSDGVFAGVFTFLLIWLTHGLLYRWRRTRIGDATVERAIARLRGR
jgi:membrane-associated PAP2 superfamily phosphatase